MLVRLTVKNFALIRDAEIQFKPGFTALTGETGSGKSLLVEALLFLSGSRAKPDIVSDDARVAVVEAEFTHPTLGVVILRREHSISGRSRAFHNDSPTTNKRLAETAAALLDITSQRAFSHLLAPARHLDFLDVYAGLSEERKNLAHCETEYRSLKRGIDELEKRVREFERNREWIEFQLQQIEEVCPSSDEAESLAGEIRRLEHAEEIHQISRRIDELLVDGPHALDAGLMEAMELFARIAEIDPALEDLTGELEGARTTIREIARRVSERCGGGNFDPERLEELRERQHQLTGLVRKFGGSLAALLENREHLLRRLEEGKEEKNQLKRMLEKRDELIGVWSKLAERVDGIRRRKARRLEEQIVGSLNRLGVEDAVFEARFALRPDPDGIYLREGRKWKLDALGTATAEFYLSTNPGHRPKPLAQVASGGELSRLLLALKEAVPPVDDEATVILDEIDVGVSGRIARMVGRKLRDLSANRQMIAITHLPQIAGLASHHLRVTKRTTGGRMETEIDELTGEERLREIALLLSSGEPTEAAFRQARNLMTNLEDDRL